MGNARLTIWNEDECQRVHEATLKVLEEVGTDVRHEGARELLARAGGFREYAKKKNITIVRQEGGRTLRFKFNYKDVSEGKHLEQNITLKSGDIVIVP